MGQKIIIFFALICLEIILLASIFTYIPSLVLAVIGTPNATVQTMLQVGNAYPEVHNTTIDNSAGSVSLVANSSKLVQCEGVVVDYNGESDIKNATAEFFDTINSGYGFSDDNNTHYTNTTCALTASFGSFNGYTDDIYSVLANCSFLVWYYATPDKWNCTILASDNESLTGIGSNTTNISSLLAIGLPDTINYGTVNATAVSDENITNVTNLGNTKVNFTLLGYARSQGDGYAMNCSQGVSPNISIGFEGYNLSMSNPGQLNYATFAADYLNLTTAPAIKNFGLPVRQNDNYNEVLNSTYWRIYIPKGVAGNCTGNILFGATIAAGS